MLPHSARTSVERCQSSPSRIGLPPCFHAAWRHHLTHLKLGRADLQTLHEPSKILSFGRIGKSLQVKHTSGGAVLTYWLSTSLMDQRHTSTLRQILAILRELQPNRPPQLCRTACLTPARSTIIPACGFHWLYNLLRCVVRVVQG